jgi:hypothetical protein
MMDAAGLRDIGGVQRAQGGRKKKPTLKQS